MADAANTDQPDAAPPGVDGGGGGTPDAAAPPPAPDRLWITPPYADDICPGQNIQLLARAIYEEEDGGETHIDITTWVNWSSEDEAVATVNDTGMLVGEGTGETVITGEYEGASDTVDVSVRADEVAGVMISPAHPQVHAGQEVELEAWLVTGCANPVEDVTATATWGSNNPNVAALVSPGTFDTFIQGATTLTVSAGGFNNQVTLVVNPPIPVSLAVTPTSVTLAPTETATLTATATFSDDSEEDVTDAALWSSMTPTIVEVIGAGEIQGVAVGGTEVHANYSSPSGGSATGWCAVTVAE